MLLTTAEVMLHKIQEFYFQMVNYAMARSQSRIFQFGQSGKALISRRSIGRPQRGSLRNKEGNHHRIAPSQNPRSIPSSPPSSPPLTIAPNACVPR